jgi:DNA-binding NtrC family response regulator
MHASGSMKSVSDCLSLRERPEDIAAIVRVRLAQLCRRMKRPTPVVSPSTLANLCAAPWPGNVRELENALERALILSPGQELRMQAPVHRMAAAPRPHAVETFRDSSIRAIQRALEATGGRIYGHGGAAELLGLKPSTLQTKMEKLGISKATTAGTRA